MVTKMSTQGDIYLINLEPAIGHEIKKTRPCVIISPNEMNKFISTIIIAPMTTKSHNYPTRVSVQFQNKKGWIVLDQIRTIDKKRLIKKVGKITPNTLNKIKSILQIMFA